MKPSVLHFVLCDDARPDSHNLHKINVYGMLFNVRSRRVPAFPCVLPLMSALVILRGGQGTGEMYLRVVQQETGRIITQSETRRGIRFSGDVNEVKGSMIRLQDCRLPNEGLYWVELVLSGERIARQPLRVTS